MSWHIAETREEARAQAGEGLMRWHNEYNVGTLMRPGAVAYGSPDEAVDMTAFADGAAIGHRRTSPHPGGAHWPHIRDRG